MTKDTPVFYALAFAAAVLGHTIGADNQREYTASLERVLAQCVGDNYGHVKIGDDHYLCGIDKL